jgi:tetratricopeptide (TPR) repeat protein
VICRNCHAEVQEWAFCPHCGYRLGDQAEYPPQEYNPHGTPDRQARWRHFFRRWVLPFVLLLVVVFFGVLGLSLLGFVDGVQERSVATRHEAEIHYNRGLIYLQWGQYQMAEIEFEEALRLAPDYSEAEAKRRLAQAGQTVTPSPTLPMLPTSTATPPPSTPTPKVVIIPVAQVLFEQGQASYEKGEWEQAISRLEQVRSEDITFRPEEVEEMLFESHKNYGMLLEEQGSLEEAISHYDSALYLRRRDAQVEELRQRADLYIKALGYWNADWERVITNLTALYALAPDYKDTSDRLYSACTTQAQVLTKQEKYCAAAELYKQALGIRKDDAEIAKLEDDTQHMCEVIGPMPLATPGNGSPAGTLHTGTLVATCYDHRTNQYSICAQNAQDNTLVTWMTEAEQPAMTLDGRALAYRSTALERPGLYAITLTVSAAVSDTASSGIVSDTAGTGASPILSATLDLDSVVTITTDATAAYPTWSLDGTRVAYAQYDAEAEDWFIYIAQIGGSETPERLGQGEWPKWGPDGRLAFTSCRDEDSCGIYVLDPASGALRRLTGSIQDRAAAWSPSGQELAYMSDVGRSFNLYVVTDGSMTVRQITRNLFHDGLPAWSPDGQRIAYVTSRDDDWSIYTCHPFGNQEKKVVTLGAESADWLDLQLAWVASIIRLAVP